LSEMRLDRLLARSGYGTRKEVRRLLRGGSVTVNGEVVQDPAMRVSPEEDEIAVEGEPVTYRPSLTLVAYKPKGYVSATRDARYPTVLELVPEEFLYRELFPVGRLDVDTTGLLLLTDDGILAHRLTSPRWRVPKVYHARVLGRVDERDREAFARGVVLEDGVRTRPAELRILEGQALAEDPVALRWAREIEAASAAESVVEVVLTEGRYHQVKRMFRTRGKEVLALHRVRFGPLALEDLREGEARLLTAAEEEDLRTLVDLA